jgi:hypothetical protein
LNIISQDPEKVPAVEVMRIQRELHETRRALKELRRVEELLSEPAVLEALRMLASRRQPSHP